METRKGMSELQKGLRPKACMRRQGLSCKSNEDDLSEFYD
jgi:hypothetical protein